MLVDKLTEGAGILVYLVQFQYPVAHFNHAHLQVAGLIVLAAIGVWIIPIALKMVRPDFRLRNVEQRSPCFGSLADVVDHDGHLDKLLFLQWCDQRLISGGRIRVLLAGNVGFHLLDAILSHDQILF